VELRHSRICEPVETAIYLFKETSVAEPTQVRAGNARVIEIARTNMAFVRHF